jgi:beta propeller repeat protein
VIGRKVLLIVAAVAVVLTATGCETTQIDPGEYNQTSPAISGSNVVWQDSRDEESLGTDVYMYDTRLETESLVAGGAGDQEEPAISSSYIVWIDGGRLRAKNRSSGAVFNVTPGPATQLDPVLCGSVVAWTDSRNSSPDVYARDLAAAGEEIIPIATSPAVESYPACDGGRIAYMYAPTGQSADIHLFDLPTRTTTVVSAQPWNEWRPAIAGNLVVWQAWPNQPDTVEGIQIMGKSLSTGQTFTVTSAPGNQLAPAISGSVVAWEDFRNGEPRLWWLNLNKEMAEEPVDSTQPGRQKAPSLTERISLAYQSDASGVWNVYTALLLTNSK